MQICRIALTKLGEIISRVRRSFLFRYISSKNLSRAIYITWVVFKPSVMMKKNSNNTATEYQCNNVSEYLFPYFDSFLCHNSCFFLQYLKTIVISFRHILQQQVCHQILSQSESTTGVVAVNMACSMTYIYVQSLYHH